MSANRGLDVAIVGTGVSGLVAASILARRHRVTLFEAGDRPGGHVHTHDIPLGGRTYPVDSGFIVYNERAYPNFIKLLAALGVPTRETSMSFALRNERTGLEYGGTGLDAVFARRANLVDPAFWALLRDVLRFGRAHRELEREGDEAVGLRAWLQARGYSASFIENYAIPMGAAIWSAAPDAMADFPARHFVRFFAHHGVLDIRKAPPWRTIVGGSRVYVERLLAPLRDRLRLNARVRRVARRPGGVDVTTAAGTERFDRVVIAAHSDQALAMLEAPTPAEREVLGAIPYQRNEALLHTDTRVMPRRRRAWSSWNYLVPAAPGRPVLVTYFMNLLQGLDAPEPLLVTLNGEGRVAPEKVLRRMVYEHPVHGAGTLAAQRRHAEIDGVGGVHYCGAYWGYGFHEDGVDSALAVVRRFGLGLEPGPESERDAETGAGTGVAAAAGVARGLEETVA